MKLGFGARQVLLLLLLGLALIITSLVLEVTSVIRLAAESVSTECGVVARAMYLAFQEHARANPSDMLSGLSEDPGIARVLETAASHAPSISWVAIADSAQVVILHTAPEQTGKILDANPPLPEPNSFAEALNILFSLRRKTVYAHDTQLKVQDRPFVTIRVGAADKLIRERVNQAVRRAMLVALVELLAAGAVGYTLSRILRKRVRDIEAGVQAIREGRFDQRIPETGAEEFRRLARDLNLLSEQFQKEQLGNGSRGPRVRRAAEVLGEALLAVDNEGRVALLSDAAAGHLSIPIQGAIGRPLAGLLPDTHPIHDLLVRLGSSDERSLTAPISGGSHVAVAHRVPGNRGMGGAVIEIKRSGEQDELHAMVDQSRVLSRLAEMAAGVAHEIRNPLAKITFQLEALKEAHELSYEEIGGHVASASSEVQQVQRAITGFLTVARLRQPTFTQFDANDLLAEVHDALASEADWAGMEVVLDLAQTSPMIEGDRQVLRQALSNLVKNALQATPSADRRVLLSSQVANGEVRLSARDRGPGISPADLERVCKLYFTTKPGGTGVGLALARQAVEMHGGELEIESEVGVGTCVTLRLPLLPRAH